MAWVRCALRDAHILGIGIVSDITDNIGPASRARARFIDYWPIRVVACCVFSLLPLLVAQVGLDLESYPL